MGASKCQRAAVGEAGFEPATSCSQSRCATAALLPGSPPAYSRREARPCCTRPSQRAVNAGGVPDLRAPALAQVAGSVCRRLVRSE